MTSIPSIRFSGIVINGRSLGEKTKLKVLYAQLTLPLFSFDSLFQINFFLPDATWQIYTDRLIKWNSNE